MWMSRALGRAAIAHQGQAHRTRGSSPYIVKTVKFQIGLHHLDVQRFVIDDQNAGSFEILQRQGCGERLAGNPGRRRFGSNGSCLIAHARLIGLVKYRWFFGWMNYTALETNLPANLRMPSSIRRASLELPALASCSSSMAGAVKQPNPMVPPEPFSQCAISAKASNSCRNLPNPAPLFCRPRQFSCAATPGMFTALAHRSERVQSTFSAGLGEIRLWRRCRLDSAS